MTRHSDSRQDAGDSPPRRMRLRSFKPVVKGTLRGFATLELPNGLVLHDVLIFAGRNGLFAALPGKPQLDRAGRQKQADGKPVYDLVAEWKSRELQDRFSAAVIEIVRAAYPGALDPTPRR